MLFWTLRQLSSSDAGKRKRAAEKLGAAGDSRAVPHLARALNDEDFWVQVNAASALGEIGGPDAVDVLLSALKGKPPGVESAAEIALGRIDPNWAESEAARRVVPEFAAALKDERDAVRNSAALALSKFGDARAQEALLAVLADKDELVREHALRALARIDPKWRESASALRAAQDFESALTDPSDEFRLGAMNALREIGGAHAVSPLSALVEDPSTRVRRAAIATLLRIDPRWRTSEAAARAAAPLIGSLNSEYWESRQDAARDLGWFGDARVVGALVAALTDRNERVREAVWRALEMIDPKWYESEPARSAIPHLVAALCHGDWAKRESARVALARIEPDWARSDAARRAVPDLIALLEAGHVEDAANFLGAIADARAVPALVGELGHSNPAAQEAVARALDRIGARWRESDATRQAIPRLVALFQSDHKDLWKAAGTALGHIGVIPLITAYLDNEPSVLRDAAAWVERMNPNWRESEAAALAAPPFMATFSDILDLQMRIAVTQALMLLQWEPRDELERVLFAREVEKVTFMHSRGLL